MNWTVESSRRILEDEWISLRADSCRTPEGELVEPFYVLDYPDWVNLVAVTGEDEVVLVRQYRHGLGRTLLELPGGAVEPTDASPADAAARELLEETGYEPGAMVESGLLSPNSASHSNLTRCFVATGCRRVGAPEQDGAERTEVSLVPLDDFARLVLDGGLLQALHVGSALFGLARLGRLDFAPASR